LVVDVAFMGRRVFLPLLLRLYVPKSGVSKTDHARTMVNLLSRAFTQRRIHVVADAWYRGPAWLRLPGNVTFTTRLSSTAVLYPPAPEPTGERGHPGWKGPRLGTAGEIASSVTWRRTSVTRYGQTAEALVADLRCLWWGSLHRTPVRLVLVRDLGRRRRADPALVTTDLVTSTEEIVCRYASRWSIEQAIKDGKDLLGVGDAQSRVQAAVERTVPFMMLTLTILVCWYARSGDVETDLAERRGWARWYHRKKTTISVTDMPIAFRRARITSVDPGQTTPGLIDGTAATSTVKAA